MVMREIILYPNTSRVCVCVCASLDSAAVAADAHLCHREALSLPLVDIYCDLGASAA